MSLLYGIVRGHREIITPAGKFPGYLIGMRLFFQLQVAGSQLNRAWVKQGEGTRNHGPGNEDPIIARVLRDENFEVHAKNNL